MRLTADDFNDIRLVDGPLISPDGKQIVWVEVVLDEVMDRANHRIWIRPASGGPARLLTSGSKAFAPAFSPDSKKVAYLANHGKGTAIFVCGIDGDQAKIQLTEAGQSPQSPRWSPDGESLAYARLVDAEAGDNPTQAEKNAPAVIRDIYFQADGTGLIGSGRRHLFVTDCQGQEHRQVTFGDWHDQDFCWTKDSLSLVFVCNRSPGRWNQFRTSALWQVRLRGLRCRRLTPEEGEAAHPRCLDSSHIVYLGSHEGGYSSRHRQILCVSLAAPPKLDILLDSQAITPSHLSLRGSPLETSDDGKMVYFLAAVRGRTPVHKLSLRSKQLTRWIDGDFQVTGISVSGDSIALVRQWASELPEVWIKPLQSGKGLKQISDVNTALSTRVPLAQVKAITYRAADHTELEMFIILPADYHEGNRYPLWLTIHGGPHGMHPALDNPLMYQIQSALGYIVMLPNPRGSVSYGQAFMKGCVQDWGGGDYLDIMAGVDELIHLGLVNDRKLYVEGYSYGGIMAAWIVGHTQRFNAAVIGAPVTDQISNFGTDDEPHFSVESLGGTPQQQPEEYRYRSALSYVDQVTTPVQLQHFEGDLRCPIGQSMQYYMALKFLGREVEFVRYPGGSHVGRTPSQWKDMLIRMNQWFKSHPGDQQADPG